MKKAIHRRLYIVSALTFLVFCLFQNPMSVNGTPADFVDISGEWKISEKLAVTYMLDGKSDLRRKSILKKVFISQSGPDISYIHHSGQTRKGRVVGRDVTFDSVSVIPTSIESPFSVMENTFEGHGTVNKYQTRMLVSGIRRVKGEIIDTKGGHHAFSITGRSTTLFKRTGFALTFDDGPVPGWTDKIINTLKHYEVNGEPVRAGFFMVGDPNFIYFMPELWVSKGSVRDNPGIVRRVVEAGHLVGNHSQHHAWFQLWRIFGFSSEEEFVKEEISLGEGELKKASGNRSLKLFRPPYLQIGDGVLKAARDMGFNVILGQTIGDSKPFVTTEEINRNTLARLNKWEREEPCILIFHDGRPTTYDNLSDTLDFLQEHGFRLCHFDPEIPPLKTLKAEKQD
jgi:peptidoglycan/xylan/chitin deacetylase (PgdA/CDA1 family)